jgi:hypothetical protein
MNLTSWLKARRPLLIRKIRSRDKQQIESSFVARPRIEHPQNAIRALLVSH